MMVILITKYKNSEWIGTILEVDTHIEEKRSKSSDGLKYCNGKAYGILVTDSYKYKY